MKMPKSVTASGSRAPKADSKKQKVRGAEVSIRQAAAAGQIIYGSFKVGGIYTFLETSKLSYAFLRFGSDNSTVGIYAKVAGAAGNEISVALTESNTHTSTSVLVTDNKITVKLRCNGSGASIATAAQVVAAINGNASAAALVKADKAEGNGTGVVEAAGETFLQFGGGQWLHQVITLAAHQITYVTDVFLDERKVAFGASPDPRWSTGYYTKTNSKGGTARLVFMAWNNGSDSQLAIPDLVNQLPAKWTDNHRQRGCAHAYMITVWDESKFPQGLPAISFQVQGKPVYDPRTSTTGYSANAALVIADYLTNTKFGLGVDWNDIDIDALIEAANVCDETVTLVDGGIEKRYEIEGVFDSSEAPQNVLQEMADAIAGDIAYQGGKWRILPGKWRAPSVALSRDDVAGAFNVTTRRSRKDTFNCVRGTLASKKHDFEPIDFPAVKVAAYIAEDGREIYKDLVLNFVTSPTQAQRIAKIRLGQIRQPIVVDVSFTVKAMSLQIGDVITYTDPLFGWANKEFEVRQFALELNTNGLITVRVSMVETASLIYSWTVADELAVDPAPNSNFPTYTDLAAVTGLALASGTEHLYVRTDGTVFARLRVSWNDSENEFVQRGGSYEVHYKQSSSATWIPSVIVTSDITNVYILDVKDGQQYDVRVRGISAAGVASDWATVTNHLVVGKTAPPSNVPSITAAVDGFGLLLQWQTIADLDVQDYEIRYGGSGDTWEAMYLTAFRVKASQYFFKTFPAGTHVFHVRAVDTSGNHSVTSATASLTIAAPGAVQSYNVGQIDNNVLVDWEPPAAGTFPISHYNVYEGGTFATAVLLGKVGGTFYTYIEQVGGTNTYWVTAVDIAGNEGTQTGKTVLVSSPPDYILIDQRTLSPDDATLTNALDQCNGTCLLAPVNITETWAQHFTNNSNSTIQDFIDDGFSVYLQPTPSSGTAEWIFDLGVVLPQNLITVSWLYTAISGAVTVSPTISWRETTTASWQSGSTGANQVFATNFRYVKVVLTMTGANNLCLARITSANCKIDTKKQNDSGSGEVTDATNGKVVNFGLDFVDVFSIVVTPLSTAARIAVVDFTDVANPTGFTVYLYNENGVKQTGKFSWVAQGVVNIS
jgi:hypothetical protein